MMSNSKGILFAFLAALISGFSVYINKFAVAAMPQPLLLTAVKNLGVGLLIIGLLVITGKWQLVKKLTKKEIILLTAIGVIGGSLPFYLFFTGLSQVPAVNAAVIQKTLVIWVAVLALPLLKERLSRRQIIAVALLFSGNLFIGGFKKFTFSPGEQMILAATILWAIETVIAKKALKTLDPDLVTAARMGLGSAILMVAAGPHLQPLTGGQLFWVLLTAAFLFAYVSVWYRALKFAGATVVTGVLVAATLVTNALSANINWSQSVLIFSGAGLLLSELYWSKRQGFFALLRLKL